MKRLLVMGVVLVLGLAGAVRAEAVKVSVRYELVGGHKLGLQEHEQVNAHVRAQLNTLVSKVMNLTDFESSRDDSALLVQFRGQWRDAASLGDAAEIVKKQVLEAGASAPNAKFSLAHYRVEIEDRATSTRERQIKQEKEELMANRERARPQPRLDIEVKDKLIEELCILDVPLVRAMERLGGAIPVAYVLQQDVVGLPVYVRLKNVTIDEALAAIAESTKVKIDKREKYLVFMLPPGK